MAQEWNDKLALTWDDYGTAIDDLTASIQASDFEPDSIIGVIRGGLVLAGALGHRLGVKTGAAINVEYYRGDGIDDEVLEAPRLLAPGVPTDVVTGQRVLLVDDVVGSGVTLAFVRELLAKEAAEVRSAVWVSKPRATERPDFVALSTDKCTVFPWSPHSPFVAGGELAKDQRASGSGVAQDAV